MVKHWVSYRFKILSFLDKNNLKLFLRRKGINKSITDNIESIDIKQDNYAWLSSKLQSTLYCYTIIIPYNWEKDTSFNTDNIFKIMEVLNTRIPKSTIKVAYSDLYDPLCIKITFSDVDQRIRMSNLVTHFKDNISRLSKSKKITSPIINDDPDYYQSNAISLNVGSVCFIRSYTENLIEIIKHLYLEAIQNTKLKQEFSSDLKTFVNLPKLVKFIEKYESIKRQADTGNN